MISGHVRDCLRKPEQRARLKLVIERRDRAKALGHEHNDVFVCLAMPRCWGHEGDCGFCPMWPRDWNVTRLDDFLRMAEQGN
jgi:hypothetical protein